MPRYGLFLTQSAPGYRVECLERQSVSIDAVFMDMLAMWTSLVYIHHLLTAAHEEDDSMVLQRSLHKPSVTKTEIVSS
jgi:hypothetical protein